LTTRSGRLSGAPVIEVAGLIKDFNGVHALAGVDLSVEAGQIFAVLGPNGAGKTTMLEILEGYLDRDSGSVLVLGEDPQRPNRGWREEIGIVLQETALEPALTAGEAIEMFSGYYSSPLPVEDVIALVGLESAVDTRTGRLSGGQRRRLDVGIALVGDPALLFLDEPTTGFDPAARRKAWEMIGGLREIGKTVLLTTHYLEEAQALADRIAILNDGLVIAEGRPDELGGPKRNRTVISFRLDGDPVTGLPDELARRVEAGQEGESVRIASDDPTGDLGLLVAWAADRGTELDSLEVRRPSLEEIYLELIG
jgi:ABC-2 type transport system ATP-binding protein